MNRDDEEFQEFFAEFTLSGIRFLPRIKYGGGMTEAKGSE